MYNKAVGYLLLILISVICGKQSIKTKITNVEGPALYASKNSYSGRKVPLKNHMYGELAIGTPSQVMSVIYDTVS